MSILLSATACRRKFKNGSVELAKDEAANMGGVEGPGGLLQTVGCNISVPLPSRKEIEENCKGWCEPQVWDA